MLYHDIPHENYDNSVSNLVIPYIYLNEWSSGFGFYVFY